MDYLHHVHMVMQVQADAGQLVLHADGKPIAAEEIRIPDSGALYG